MWVDKKVNACFTHELVLSVRVSLFLCGHSDTCFRRVQVHSSYHFLDYIIFHSKG